MIIIRHEAPKLQQSHIAARALYIIEDIRSFKETRTERNVPRRSGPRRSRHRRRAGVFNWSVYMAAAAAAAARVCSKKREEERAAAAASAAAAQD